MEYLKGSEARKNFEEGMRKLFRVPKSAVSTTQPKPKKETKKGDRVK
jgi:hypothetical protein